MARHKVPTLGLVRSDIPKLVAVVYDAATAALASDLSDEFCSDIWTFDFYALPWAHPALQIVEWFGEPPRRACPCNARAGSLALAELPHFYETKEMPKHQAGRHCYFATYPVGGFLL